ncbi:hypothetical protein ELI44_32940 (plasmid) [Rhizobium ruizarguesonis]|uniref:hypothetical protein n=1 Tax=Rhizobium ruizarguesonis TaxID=2081791 RepID=UPI00103257FE|nr:hypothetical protein [Rhizobium ruizarguesonis]TAU37811.1 hypothetical protein ELI42_33195 [Rhizobium ruizarguesonis]TAU51274.1 hypothetical protein ELI44_32940 [Rhizobium ruizarguesonis]
MQKFIAEVSFECPNCSEAGYDQVAIPEPGWAAAESSAELFSEGETFVWCSNCETCYDAYVLNDAGSCTITLNDHPGVIVFASDAHFSPEEWPEPDPPNDPRGVFEFHQAEIEALLLAVGRDSDGSTLINRLLFASVITGMETYLSDTLRNVVNSRAAALASLVEKEKELVKQKFSLADIARRPNLVREAVNEHLREVMYHNLPKVNSLYHNATDIDFIRLLGPELMAELSRAIEYRHHCVHRNGKDQDGNILDIFTREYIQRVQNQVITLVRNIDDHIGRFVEAV